MAGRVRAVGAGLLVVLLALPGLLPTDAAPGAAPASALTSAFTAPTTALTLADLKDHLAGLAPGILPERYLPEALGRALDPLAWATRVPPAPPSWLAHALDHDEEEVWTGDVLVGESRGFSHLRVEDARVRFTTPGSALYVHGRLEVVNSSFVGLPPDAQGFDNSVRAFDLATVRNASFERVALSLSETGLALPARVEDSAFRGLGLVVERRATEVLRSTFAGAGTGIHVVTHSGGDPFEGPRIHNNTLEMNVYGLRVDGRVAGTYRHNLARGNVFGVACNTLGVPDGNGGYHPPRFEQNNVYTNLGDALAGVRGVTIPTPIGPLELPGSGCVHDRPYLGPSGAARDSVFLSVQDSLTNVTSAPNPTSAPPLPLPLREVTTTETWGPGTVRLEGPVVVNHPGNLRLHNATVEGPALWGSKVNGRVRVENVTADHVGMLVLRNQGDALVDSQLRSDSTATLLYRCNCTVAGTRFDVGPGGSGVIALGGIYSDDTAWRPEIRDSTFRGPGGHPSTGLGAVAGVASATVRGNSFEGLQIGAASILGAATLRDNTFRGNYGHYVGGLGSTTSSGNAFDGGLVGVLSLLDTDTFTQDVFAGNALGLVPALSPPVTVSLGNLTLNAVGVLPLLSVANLASTNLVDNYLFALAAIPLPLNSVDVPTGITCTNCWSPSDEAWHGNVSYTPALVANSVPAPSWAGAVQRALAGQVVDLEGALEAPAVARSGGTLRVANTTLDLGGRFPFGAKGGGPSGLATGRVSLDNATVVNGGFVALNSTDSRLVQARFRGFPDAAFQVAWNRGGTFDCLAFEGTPAAVRLNLLHPGTGGFLARRMLVEGNRGVVAGLDLVPVPGNLSVTVEDSGIHGRHDGLLRRTQGGDAVVRRSNLLGEGRPGVVDDLSDRNATALDARDNWWDSPEGPGSHGTYASWREVPPRLQPFRTAPVPVAPCPAFAVTTAAPAEDGPVAFVDHTLDASALGASRRRWQWNDGSPSEDVPAPEAQHRFLDGGAYTVVLTYDSASGANADVARTVQVAHTPPLPAFAETVADEVTPVAYQDLSTHGNPRDAPAEGWAYRWTFGDGQSSTAREPAHRYADGGAYAVRLNVTDDDGLAAEATRSLLVPHVPPVAAFVAQGSVETDPFQLADASTHPNAPTDRLVARAWSCSDGFASAATNASHRFADGGTYTCTLAVTDDDGLGHTATRTLQVAHAPPVAGLAVGPAVETAPVAFTDQSTHPNPADRPPSGWTFAWDFGDGATSTARSPARTFAEGGSYLVRLQVVDDDGLASEAQRLVEVAHAPPVAAFTTAPELPGPGEAVAFTDTSLHPHAPTDAIVAWHWDFGDGNASAEPSPVHTFAERGQYPVTLTVTDDDGLLASAVHVVSVGNIPPVPSFALAPSDPTDLDEVQLTDLSTDADGEVVAWTWDFGDGTTSALRHPTHRWVDNGAYVVRLTVTDDRGALATLALLVEVRNVPPEAAFGLGPDDPIAGEVVQFEDYSADPDGSVASRRWDFGDGTTSEDARPSHAWARGGDYLVRLTVSDDDGATGVAERLVHVCETGVGLDPLRVELCLRLQPG